MDRPAFPQPSPEDLTAALELLAAALLQGSKR